MDREYCQQFKDGNRIVYYFLEEINWDMDSQMLHIFWNAHQGKILKPNKEFSAFFKLLVRHTGSITFSEDTSTWVSKHF